MVILYSSHCPKCTMLEKQLKKFNIEFEICDDLNVMKELGISTVPYIMADSQLMDFATAWKWAAARGVNGN